MRQLNETFEDIEFEELKKAKGEKTWRDFILKLAGINKKEVRNNEN